jgi:hypothetical protein
VNSMATIEMTTARSGGLIARNELLAPKRRTPKTEARMPSSENWQLERTRHEILVDWSKIRDASPDTIRNGFAQAIRHCKSLSKDEFVVENIVPDHTVGQDDPAKVIAAQTQIAALFREAARAENRSMPEYRLSLRRGAFDVRFYLGRTRPTDHKAPEEEL